MANTDVNMQDAAPDDAADPEPLMEAVDEAPATDNGDGVPMAITEGKAGSTEEPEEEEDPLEGSYTWDMTDAIRNRDNKRYSPEFTVGGYPWRILVFPRGNRSLGQLSAYLDCGDTSQCPPNWTRRANFKLLLINQRDSTKSICKEAAYHFSAQTNDWGFTQFAAQQDAYSPKEGFLVNDTLHFNVVVRIDRQEDYNYDSKKATGYVGLKNQGATCYMNSLLQTLYNINYFRQAVYHMPTQDLEVPASSVPLALQSTFYKLQFGDSSVSTKDLTKSFGWDTMDSFMQHDVQELNRVLCDNLEEKMKNTKVQGAINHLFEGHTFNYVECINVEYKSTRKESYMDLQLDVKGCKNVYESFAKYTEVEMLDGQNQYKAEGHGLQDARKGVLFDDFPPVLQLQLKRFEYDFQRDIMVKINDRYEFPDQLDLDVEDGKFLSPDADRNVRNLYKLHSVLVHSGGVHGGHYFAYIRPSGKQWLRYDDERVYKESSKRAMNEQYGGEDESPPPAPGFTSPTLKLTKSSNAYMLVYVRESSWNDIMRDVSRNDIAEHVSSRLQAEAEDKERRRKEKMDAHLYTIIKLARDTDLRSQIGDSQFFDLVDHEKVEHFRVKRLTVMSDLKQLVAQKWQVPVDRQRYWHWATRQNHSVRVSSPLGAESDNVKVCDIRDSGAAPYGRLQSAQSDLRLYLEVPSAEGRPLHQRAPDEFLLFFKLYDPVKEHLAYLGSFYARRQQKLPDLVPALNKMAGFPEGTALEAAEEVKFEPKVMCEQLDRRQTLHQAQLENGDILIIQQALSKACKVVQEDEAKLRYPRAKDFLEYIKYRKLVHFKKLDNPKEEGLALELSINNTYEEVSQQLAKALQPPLEDPLCLRFTQQHNYSQQPKATPLRHPGAAQQDQLLPDMLTQFQQMADTLFYEVLDLPLPELERLKTLKIAFHGQKAEEVSQHQLRLPKDSCIEHVLQELRKQLPSSYASAPLRLLETYMSKIFKVFDEKDDIDNINDQYWQLRAEAIPEDQLSVSEQDQLIPLYHFSCDQHSTVHTFGDPVLFRISDAEALADIKPRIQRTLGIADEEFAKWKFSINFSLRPPEYLADEDNIAAKFSKASNNYNSGHDHTYLGLEHTDAHPHRHRHHNNRMSHYERPVKIYN